MIAGGTGITPFLQVLRKIFSHPEDKTQLSLIFANISPSDILLKAELDAMAAAHKDQFKVHYVVEKPTDDWKESVGYVTADLIKQHLPPPSQDSIIFVCGPPGMMAAISGEKNPDKSQGLLKGLLKDLGYAEDIVYKF
jgi:cytochrome-b5 reductase